MTPPSSLRRGLGLAALAAALAAGCKHAEPFVWVDKLPPEKADDGAYQIAPGDVLAVRVWGQETMSNPRILVRDDGRISMPFLQDVDAQGLTPTELGRSLEVKLKAYVVNPVVTVTVEVARPVRVSVLGEVTRAGAYELERGSLLIQALAAAGGRTPYASGDGIYVLRQSGAPGKPETLRIRFRWDDLAGGKLPAAGFKMRHGDVVVVE